MAKKPAFCPVEKTLALIAGKWKVMIIYYLLQDTKRFNQLQRDLGELPIARSVSSLKRWKMMASLSVPITARYRHGWNIAFRL